MRDPLTTYTTFFCLVPGIFQASDEIRYGTALRGKCTSGPGDLPGAANQGVFGTAATDPLAQYQCDDEDAGREEWGRKKHLGKSYYSEICVTQSSKPDDHIEKPHNLALICL